MGKIIVGNWKMLLSMSDAMGLAHALAQQSVTPSVTAIVCPSFPLLSTARAFLTSSSIQLGAQDCSPFAHGAYTGDVSPFVLKELGCAYVILGHSERRSFHHETNALVRQKAENALGAGLIPIICIGEPEDVNRAGDTLPFLEQQLKESCPVVPGPYIVAYEPVWAIGTGRTPQLEDIERLHTALKGVLPQNTPLLYGGSVTAQNASSILTLSNVDGLLVGGASTQISQFKEILHAAF